MTSTEDWGPWIAWCGARRTCPVPAGGFIQVDENHHGVRRRRSFRVDTAIFSAPFWQATQPFGAHPMILRYRVRIPGGMALLRQQLNVPAIGKCAAAPIRRRFS